MTCFINSCNNKKIGKGLCRKHYMSQYRNNPKQKIKEKELWQRWFDKNKEHYKKNRKENRSTKEFKDRCNKLKRIRYNNDIDFKLRIILRTAFSRLLNGKSKKYKSEEYLGCSVEELKKYIEFQFQPGMLWDNWSRNGWHIDHIKSLSSFGTTEEEFKKACHYSNLQPLWWRDNISKGNN